MIGRNLEPVFLEMPVKCESAVDFHGIHDFEAEAVHKADTLSALGKSSLALTGASQQAARIPCRSLLIIIHLSLLLPSWT